MVPEVLPAVTVPRPLDKKDRAAIIAGFGEEQARAPRHTVGHSLLRRSPEKWSRHFWSRDCGKH